MSAKSEEELAKGLGIKARRVIAYIVLILISFICLVWFYILIINATRSHGELTQGFTPLPSTHLIGNYKKINVKLHVDALQGMVNSLIIASCTAALCTYFSTMTAYAIHAYDFKGRKGILTFILAVMMIPTQVMALGFIDLIRNTFTFMQNSFIPLIVPAIASPIVFYYLRQYMMSALPLSLIEAARIDGSSEFRTFNKIVLPLMKPAIAVQAIFSFVSSWNNYFTPALLLEGDKRTLPVLLSVIRNTSQNKVDNGANYTMIAFSIFPVIIVYLVLSKNIVGGVALGGVKG